MGLKLRMLIDLLCRVSLLGIFPCRLNYLGIKLVGVLSFVLSSSSRSLFLSFTGKNRFKVLFGTRNKFKVEFINQHFQYRR